MVFKKCCYKKETPQCDVSTCSLVDLLSYFVASSSHLTMPNMIAIETKQIPANTAQQIHWCGNVLSIVTPIAMNKLPIAVAVSHKPWQIPCKCLGATFDTNDNQRGEMNNSATVKKK